MAGRPEDVDDETILRVVSRKSNPVSFTGEVAEELPIKNRQASNRLRTLVDNGLVDRKKWKNLTVWWITEQGRAYLAGELDTDDLED